MPTFARDYVNSIPPWVAQLFHFNAVETLRTHSRVHTRQSTSKRGHWMVEQKMGLPSIIASNLSILSTTASSVDLDIANGCADDEPDCDRYRPYGERPETYIIPVIFSIIFVVGVVGNGTLIVIFLKHRAMRNIPNTWVWSIFVFPYWDARWPLIY